MISRSFSLARALLGQLARPTLVTSVIGVASAAAIVFLFLSTPATTSPTLNAAQGKQRPAATDFTQGADWLNTDKPITMAQLKGRIVLLDFWTLCCINCIHTLPDLAVLEARYPGILVVIGVHSPKFENEKKTSSIMKAVLRYDIKHPVMNDADHRMWKAYGINAWPSLVLIDPDGNYYGTASGEGNLELVDVHIKKLIKEFKGKLNDKPITFKLEKEKAVTPLYFPGKVVPDVAGKRVFIADSTNNRIVITDLDGKKIDVAGSGKEGLRDGIFADAEFSDPQGMALDGDILYVADRKNHSIRALNLKDKTVSLVAGTGEQNRFGRLGKSGPATKIGLNSPWDLLLHEKKIYIAMAGHHQIWTFDPAKKVVATYAGNGAEAVIDGTLTGSAFAQPSGLATDGKLIYIADSESSAVRSVPLSGVKGNVDTVVGVSGPNEHLFNFGDKNGKGRDVRLQHALGIAFEAGKLYVADTYNNKIKIVDPKTRVCDTWLEGDLNEPGGVQIAGGKMYIADTNNHRIQIVDMKSKEVSTLRLQGVVGIKRDTEVGSKDKK